MLTHPCLEQLQKMRLTGMLKALKEQLQLEDYQAMTFEERLGLMLDREITEAAQTMGASPLRAFFTVVVPILRPAMVTAWIILFVFTMGALVTPQWLGKPEHWMFANHIASEVFERGNVPFGPDAGEGWSGMSTIHAVTRSVRDSAALLDATGGGDVGAPYSAPAKERPYLEEVGRTPEGLRIALVTDSFNGTEVHADCAEAAEDAAQLCESLGHRIEPITLKVDREALGGATQAIIGGNVRATVERRAATLGREPGPDDLEPFTQRMYEAAANASAADYARGQLAIHAAGRVVASVLESYDLILTPTMGAPPEKLGVLSLANENLGAMIGALLRSVAFTQLINGTGQPAISLPLHWNAAGLPIGAHFVAALGGEGLLYRLAGQLEAERPWFDRVPEMS